MNLSFPHAETFYAPPPGRADAPAAEWCARMHGRPSVDMDHRRGTSRKRPLLVRLGHGRWIIDCPCGSAQLASISDPRLWCVECGNSDSDGKWRRITWPDDPAAIENLLAGRAVANRNWYPDETPLDLAAENQAHGVAV